MKCTKNNSKCGKLASLAALALLAGATSVVQAASIEVQVGYADGLRPSPFFPSPWAGGAGVTTFAALADGPTAAEPPG